ncbi:esterase/lipase family protein [Marinobacter daqiaonensis]|nr:alpha/beta fold hydrolase [Marinobacter daqiaonensis]
MTELAGYSLGKPYSAKPGDGHPVILFPGLGADGRSVAPLRAFCNSLGYDAFDWGQGFNLGPKGDLDGWLDSIKSRIVDLLSDHTQPATLIGWSLGGFYARELAKLMAPHVREVITLGTPFNAEADHTNVGWLFRLINGSPLAYDPALSQRLRTPPPIHTTSIYSRSDGVVSWKTCCHLERSDLVHDIEIRGSHLGMGWNRDVLAAIANRLAQ